MKIIYFDICAIPLFLMILFICYSRKMTKGNANLLFIAVVLLSLFSAVTDLGMEITDNMVPLSGAGHILCAASTYIYLIVRNATNAVLLLFLLELTRTTFLIRRRWVKAAFCAPYACTLLLLALNPFTHAAFTVTAERGYARGPLMLAFYGIAAVYGITGLAYCIYCRRYLAKRKWAALLTVYLLVHAAVAVQYFHPELLLEMFFTAMAELVIMLAIMRPEERMDSDVGMLSWSSYQRDVRNILRSGEPVQIVVIRMLNCREIRTFLGDHKYNDYISEIAGELRAIQWERRHSIDLYFERPGTIYLITPDEGTGGENAGERLLAESGDLIRRYGDRGVRFEPRVCLIRCPEDLNKLGDIISLGHKFTALDRRKRTTFRAAEIVHSREFAIEAHIEEILDRALHGHTLEMYYQPIYDVRGGCFRSAEALARIIDPEFGLISPSFFIPAAETLGLIVPIGDMVLDQVFRFAAAHDLDALGLHFIELNLSVAQCMESALPEKIAALQAKYGVDPAQINLEITETTFENISEVMLENVNALIGMGYSFALDDYGIGYSSIQRINHLPLKLIKLDKSMLDEVFTDSGRMILEHTVRMMQSIGKQLVVEGAETRDAVDVLERMDCDFIQGFYFSEPLPAEAFVRYIEAHNGRETA